MDKVEVGNVPKFVVKGSWGRSRALGMNENMLLNLRDVIRNAALGIGTQTMSDLHEIIFETEDKLEQAKFFLVKWQDVPEVADYLFNLWREVLVTRMEMEAQPQKDSTDFSEGSILCVDACPKQGGGFFYCSKSKTCVTFQVLFAEDLGVVVGTHSSVFEMLNLLFALFLFKQKLSNCNSIRLLTDNTKIRNSKSCALVTVIHKILNWLETHNDLKIVNKPGIDFELTRREKDTKVFIRYADCLSKNLSFESGNYQEFDGITKFAISKQVIQRYKNIF